MASRTLGTPDIVDQRVKEHELRQQNPDGVGGEKALQRASQIGEVRTAIRPVFAKKLISADTNGN